MARRDKYDIHKIRKQVKNKVGRHNDPTEFKPPKADDGKPPIKFRFYVLPPFEKGDELATGAAEQSMEEFFLRNGSHYMDNKRLGCPRVIDDEDCPICQHGFDLMSETSERDQKRDIAKRLLPGTYYMVNIYFPNVKPNPEDLRGQVRWYNCPKTVFDTWEDCLFRDDDGGDPQEPLPFGVFYDEEDAYLFQLEVVKFGQANSYSKSKFFLTESMRTRPLVGKPNAPDKEKIATILAKRHNLFDKTPEVVAADIERVANNLTGGDGGSGGGFDSDETSQDQTEKPSGQKGGGIRPKVSESSSTKARTPDDDDLSGLGESIDEPAEKSAEEPVAGEIPVDEASEALQAPEKEKAADDDADDADVDALLDQLSDD